MSETEDRLIKTETEITHIKEDIREMRSDIKNINCVTNDFNVKIDRLTVAMDNNAIVTQRLTDYMNKQLNKGNVAFGKIGWLVIGALVSGIVGLVFTFLK